MFRAVGVILILWYLSSLFMQTFSAADDAFTATFEALEAAANVTEEMMKSQ